MRSRFARPKRCSGQAGVSLIELLIAISLTAVITVPIVASIYFGFRTTGDTQTRISQTASANVLASYFVPDVQGSIAAATNATESTAACGATAAPVSLLITTSITPASSISYVQGTGVNSGTLYRRTCTSGASTGLARVASSLVGTPDFHCDTGDCSGFRTVFANVAQSDATGNITYTTHLQAVRRAG
jgi:Tfp pilus assembly protein PilW